jgi:hypothetical protein
VHHTGHITAVQRLGDQPWIGEVTDDAADRRVGVRIAINYGDRVTPAGKSSDSGTTDEAGAPRDHDPTGLGWWSGHRRGA